MARAVRDSKLDSRAARLKLPATSKPYFKALDKALHLGYRKNKSGGRWVVRYSLDGGHTYATVTLDGHADDYADADGQLVLSFSHAQAQARTVYDTAKRQADGLEVPHLGPYKVKDAIKDYLDALDQGGRKSAKDSRTRADALILPTLGDKDVAKLKAKDIKEWMDVAVKTPPRLRSKAGKGQQFREVDLDDPEIRRKRQSTVNRTLTILKAALNHAWREGKVLTDDAWRRVQAFKEADAARVRYLTTVEAKRLLNACPEDFRRLVQAALTTGCRYGELTRLRVADFNPDSKTIHVRLSKSGKGRHIYLGQEGATLFETLTAGKTAAAFILTRDNGETWGKSHQSRPLKDACKVGKIVPAMSFHEIRHTWASLAIMAGAPLMVVAKNLGHADTRMVEKHYGHLSDSYMAQAVRAATPTFGFDESNVVAIGGAAK